MGDSHHDPLRVDFDRQIKLEFHGSTVTTDAGLLAYRELDDALELTSTAASGLQDTRTGQERKIAPWLKRPVGRPSRKPKVFYYNLRYRAGSWDCARRVVVKVEWHAGELFPRVGFLVTNLKGRAKKVV